MKVFIVFRDKEVLDVFKTKTLAENYIKNFVEWSNKNSPSTSYLLNQDGCYEKWYKINFSTPDGCYEKWCKPGVTGEKIYMVKYNVRTIDHIDF